MRSSLSIRGNDPPVMEMREDAPRGQAVVR
jgi:hypothetical protein